MSLFRFEQGPVECVMEEDLCNTTEIGSSYDFFFDEFKIDLMKNGFSEKNFSDFKNFPDFCEFSDFKNIPDF